jgi:hypothetical protein
MNASPHSTFAGYLAAQTRRVQTNPKLRLPVVTISRETGAGAVSVARLLAVQLDRRNRESQVPPWTVFDRNIVEKVLEDHKLPEATRDYIHEDTIFVFKDAVEEQLGLHPLNWTLVQHTSNTILHLARLGNVILVGRGSNVIAAGVPGAVHVRLVAPLAQRIEHAAEFHRLDPKKAAEFVRKKDRARKRYLKRYFGVSIDDPLQYDLVINTGKVGFERAAHVIAKATPRLAA